VGRIKTPEEESNKENTNRRMKD